jgi:8-oxo-dGTP pyrophosphatase MutT (NUDIX family)
VLLVREGGSVASPIEVYMIRRHRGMRFLGGFYAFPGGKVDAADADADVLARVRGVSVSEAGACFDHPGGPPPIAYWVTAARELLEETGVIYACEADGRPLDPHVPDVHAAIDACRRDVMAGMRFAEALARRGWWPDLRALRYLSHFTTPQRSPIRFTARFFVCPAPAGQEPRLFTEETSEGFWIAPAEAYWRFIDDEMAMAEPAEYALAYLSQFGSLAELWTAHADGRARFEGTSHRRDGIDPEWRRFRFPDRAKARG